LVESAIARSGFKLLQGSGACAANPVGESHFIPHEGDHGSAELLLKLRTMMRLTILPSLQGGKNTMP